MKRTAGAGLLFLIMATAGAPTLHAQQRSPLPHIGYIYPAGAQRGTTCQVAVGGQFLGGAQGLMVSGSGVKISELKVRKGISGKRVTEFEEAIQVARKKASDAKELPPGMKRFDLPEGMTQVLKEAGGTEEEIAAFFEQRRVRTDPKRQLNSQLRETVTLTMDIAQDAAPGPREVRIVGPGTISNPLSFCISRFPELIKTGTLGKTLETAPRIELPTVLNGQLLPGEVDHYAFHAGLGYGLVIAVQGRDLIPYLADAVPGWFQPIVTLFNSKGEEVAYANDYRFSPDPVLFYNVPQEGDYLVEIRDALYRGREDFVYRVTVGGVPFVTGIFPMGGRKGEACAVDVTGWNVSRPRAIFKASQSEGIHRVDDLSNGFIIGDVSFCSDSLPEVMDKEPNNDPKSAQKITRPVIINGRINTPGDVDVFSFNCKAGEKVVAEVVARRLNSPLDSFLKVTDETGLQMAFNDDMDDKASGLITHQADSYLTFTAPADGLYYVTLGDSQHMGGPEYSYRLRISSPQPDFALRIVPSSICTRAGAAVPVTVYALRKDGYLGDITLSLKNAPQGVGIQGGCIPSGLNSIRATMTFPPTANLKPVPLEIEGHAMVENHEAVHPVVPADDMLQAFIYHHLVPANALYATWVGTTGTRSVPANPEPTVLVAGDVASVVINAPGWVPTNQGKVLLELSEPPEGINVESVAVTSGTIIATVRTSPQVKPGLRGNLILEAFIERTPTPPAPTPAKKPEPTPAPAKKPEPTPTPAKKPEPTPTSAKKPEPTPTPSKKPEPTPTPSKKLEPTPTPAKKPEPTPTPGKKPEPTPTPAKKPEPTPTPAKKPEPTPTPSQKLEKVRTSQGLLPAIPFKVVAKPVPTESH